LTELSGVLKPSAAKRLLYFINHTDAKRSTLLLGPPGIGKSILVREVAEETARAAGLTFLEYRRQNLRTADLEEIFAHPDRYFVFVDLRLTETEPVDLLGRPATISIRERRQLVYHPPQWAVLLAEVPGILFLDELTNVQRPDVLAAAYKLIQDRAAGFVGFGPGVHVIAAGNRPEDSVLANPLPAPLLNRVYQITVEPPRIEQWMRWMNTNHPGGHNHVFAYLQRFPQDFCRVPAEGETLESYPTPRSYTSLARDLPAAIEAGLDRPALRALCIAALGREVGQKFFTFLEYNVPAYETFIKNPAVFAALDVDQRYIGVVVVGQGLAATVTAASGGVAGDDIMEARAALRPHVTNCIPLLDVMAGQSREYLTLLWYLIASRLSHPWNDALFLEMCAQSEPVMQAYAAIGELLG